MPLFSKFSLLALMTSLLPVEDAFVAQVNASQENPQQPTASNQKVFAPQPPESHESGAILQKARMLLQTGSLNEADYFAQQYLEKVPNSAEGHFLLGSILLKEGKAKESLAEYTSGARYHDPSAQDLKAVALDYVVLGDYASADKWLTKSLEWNPSDSEGWYYLGRTKYNENKFEEAIKAFDECLKLDPKNVKAQANLGLSLEGFGRTEDAFAAYQKAIAWQSQNSLKNAEPFIDMGNLLVEQNRLEEAVPYLVQAVSISPLQSRAHEKLGKAYLRLNQLSLAQKEFGKAMELEPNSAPLHYMLGQVYRKEGMTDKAKLELDRAAALNGTHSSPESSN